MFTSILDCNHRHGGGIWFASSAMAPAPAPAPAHSQNGQVEHGHEHQRRPWGGLPTHCFYRPWITRHMLRIASTDRLTVGDSKLEADAAQAKLTRAGVPGEACPPQ